jgi:hypothetical protein
MGGYYGKFADGFLGCPGEANTRTENKRNAAGKKLAAFQEGLNQTLVVRP